MKDSYEERVRQLKRWEMHMFAEPPVLTDEAGRFEVRELREGRYRLRAEAHADGARGYVDDVALGSDGQPAAYDSAGGA